MKNNSTTVAIPQRKLPAIINYTISENNEIVQNTCFWKCSTKDPHQSVNIPIGKAMKGSITLLHDPLSKNKKVLQQVRIYRKTRQNNTTSIYSTHHARVNVSRSRITVSLSFPLNNDPTRLQARMQNFANIIIDETDEIAALLNHDGYEKIQDAWQTLQNNLQENQCNTQ
jgi:hypothetical protein